MRHRVVEGSLVFVDISGFTAMSERLARLGRVGAEEVTDLLNHTFSRLLSVAYEDGGSLLKFGGDALLVQFDGAGHADRGVHAAWGMRRKLRELQPLQSSAGLVRLRMSVGVHTGSIDQFLVGSRHRELIVAGPAATQTVRMEGAATAGEILASPSVVEAMAGRATFTPKGPGALLRGTPPPPPIVPGVDFRLDAADVAGHLLSDQIRQRLEAGGTESEHRPSVVGFLKFTGVDDLLAAEGGVAAATALERVIDVVSEAAAPDDVCLLSTDVDANGVKVILTAGVPTSQEFDGERMLRALRRVVESDLPLPVKVGVNHGPVFAGVIGPRFRLTYSIIGDAVNTAARVMAKADPGEVLATAEVINRSQALFEITELPPFAVKGKKHPLTAYRIGPVTADRLRRPRARFRLAGRRDELDVLLGEVDAAAEGHGRVVQLTGPAGIGKSRLVDELHERRPHASLVMAACNQYESATPYHVVGALVRSILGLRATATGEDLGAALAARAPQLLDAVPLLGNVVGVAVSDNDATRDLTATYRADRAAAAVCALLDVTLAEPSILVVEDLHWVDPESWTVIRRIVRSLPRRRWLLVLTSRHRLVLDIEIDGDEPIDERAVELGPLTPEVARELVFAAVEEGLVPIDRGQLLLERADGNPLFLQELLQAGVSGELPDSVDALVQTQLDQLTPRDREVLGYAAVLGADIDVDLLERTAGIAPAEQRATFRRLSSFVEPAGTGGFRFRHALVRDGAYGRLPFRRRRELHRAAARALEDEVPRRADLLALHTFHARDWERARSYALEAADAAAARYANLTAADHYRRTLEASRFAGRGHDAARTWERLGDVLLLASSYEEAVDAYRRARQLAPAGRQVHLCGQIGQLRERQGRFDEALRWLNRAARLAGETGSIELSRLLAETGIVKIRQGKPKEALSLAARAAVPIAGVLDEARASYVQAWAALQLGEDRVDEQRRMVERFEASGDVIGLSLAHQLVAMAAYYRGDWDEAATAYLAGGALRRRVGDEVAAAVSAGNLGELLSDQGHFDRARGLLDECRTVCAATGFRSSRHFAEMTLGRLEARLGNHEAADALLRGALASLETMGMGGLVFDAQRLLGEALLFRGDFGAALAQADVVDQSAALGFPAARLVGLRLRACAQLAAGHLDAAVGSARELLGRLDPSARDYDTALSLVAVATALTEAGDSAAGGIHARAAAALRRLGVVVPGELLVFGPDSPRVGATPVVFATPAPAAEPIVDAVAGR